MAPFIGNRIGVGRSGRAALAAVATPTFDITAGNYASDEAVTISCATSGASILYRTTDDTGLTSAWATYSAPVTMIYPGGTLEAYATHSGMSDSATASAAYTFDMPADVADAELRLDEPVGANVVLNGSKIATWKNNGTAGSTLDVTEATDANRPAQNTTGGRWGGAAAVFVAASSQRLRGGSAYSIPQPYTRLVRAVSSGAGGTNRSLMGTYAGAFTTGSLYFSTASQVSASCGTTLNNNQNVDGTNSWGSWWVACDDAGSGSRLGRSDKDHHTPPYSVSTGAVNTGTATGVTIGAQGNNALYLDGSIDRVLLWKRNKSEAAIVKAREYWDGLAYRYVVCDGDSLTVGVAPATPYPNLLRTNYNSALHQITNYGVSGQTLADMAADFATQIAPVVVARRVNLYVMWGGRNDVSSGADAATILSRLYGLSAAAAAAGFTVVVVTITKSGTDTGAMETVRQTVNADVLANYASHGIAAIADIGNAPEAQDTSNLTYFNADTKHGTTALNQVVANLVQAATTSLGW